ncbi:MAG: DUF3035 domain-containing protein [Alphaproteobacteria bacterium]|nr:DUF3035 domain-containing protein [Alphaproteobacteria bacterium]NDC56471.1 DUF3035 domain-containing protein [Alphaproteobacteria bacterium]NDG04612.1 DUF3035 domain-containing protein [Alphaproteobacteria bacterium]
MPPFLLFLLAVVVVTALGGCGSVRENLGLGRQPPNEFLVVDRPSLAVPPNFSLRPPGTQGGSPQDIDLTKRAAQLAFGPDAGATPAPALAGGSSLEAQLIEKAGQPEGNIRATIDRESTDLVESNKRFVDYILNWRGNRQPPAAVVDPALEKERITTNVEQKKPLNEGGTPIIERKQGGFLGL